MPFLASLVLLGLPDGEISDCLDASPECEDAGPWSCEENGCPLPSITCDYLASADTCDKTFGAVWEQPPPEVGSHEVWRLCPLSCQMCGLASVAIDDVATQAWAEHTAEHTEEPEEAEPEHSTQKNHKKHSPELPTGQKLARWSADEVWSAAADWSVTVDTPQLTATMLDRAVRMLLAAGFVVLRGNAMFTDADLRRANATVHSEYYGLRCAAAARGFGALPWGPTPGSFGQPPEDRFFTEEAVSWSPGRLDMVRLALRDPTQPAPRSPAV